MNNHEIERIAAAMHVARPDWPAASIATLIRKNLADRPRRDVFVALAWVASEANSATPARVLETGPWWKAAGVEEQATTTRGGVKVYGTTEGDPREVCGICGMHRADCERRAATNGHEFIPRTRCLPPIERAAIDRRPIKFCGAAVIGGTACDLPPGHEGDHRMTADRAARPQTTDEAEEAS